MWLILSSSKTARYRDDVIRVTSLPRSAQITFRYHESLVSKDLWPRSNKVSKVVGAGLICYFDSDAFAQARKDGNAAASVALIPLRICQVTATRPRASIVVLTLQMERYAYAQDLPAFNKLVIQTINENLPDACSEKGGLLCHKVDDKLLPEFGLIQAYEIRAWQDVISDLVERPDFCDIRAFACVSDLIETDSQDYIKKRDGVLQLALKTPYTIVIVHITRHAKPASGRLKVTSPSTNIVFVSLSDQPVDSHYDVKTFRFETLHVMTDEYSYLLFELTQEVDQETPASLQFDIPFKLVASTWRNFGVMLAFGLLVAAVGIKPDETTAWGFFAAYALRALAAGLAAFLAFYGIKRPF